MKQIKTIIAAGLLAVPLLYTAGCTVQGNQERIAHEILGAVKKGKVNMPIAAVQDIDAFLEDIAMSSDNVESREDVIAMAKKVLSEESPQRIATTMHFLNEIYEDSQDINFYHDNAKTLISVMQGSKFSNDDNLRIIGSLDYSLNQGGNIQSDKESISEIIDASAIIIQGTKDLNRVSADDVIAAENMLNQYSDRLENVVDIARASLTVLKGLNSASYFKKADLQVMAALTNSKVPIDAQHLSESTVRMIGFIEYTHLPSEQVSVIINILINESDYPTEQASDLVAALESVQEDIKRDDRITGQLICQNLAEFKKEKGKYNSRQILQTVIKDIKKDGLLISRGIDDKERYLYEEYKGIQYSPEVVTLEELEDQQKKYEGKFVRITAKPQDFSIVALYKNNEGIVINMYQDQGMILCLGRNLSENGMSNKLEENLSSVIRDKGDIQVIGKYQDNHLDLISATMRGEEIRFW